MRKNHFDQILTTFKELHKSYPSYNLGRHLSTALADYGDVWNVTDKEMLFALQKYQTTLSIDVFHEEDIEKIIEDGKNLGKSFIYDDEEEEDY